MPCSSCGKNRARRMAERAAMAGIVLHEIGPFPDHEPAQHEAPSDESTVEPSPDDES